MITMPLHGFTETVIIDWRLVIGSLFIPRVPACMSGVIAQRTVAFSITGMESNALTRERRLRLNSTSKLKGASDCRSPSFIAAPDCCLIAGRMLAYSVWPLKHRLVRYKLAVGSSNASAHSAAAATNTDKGSDSKTVGTRDAPAMCALR